MKDNISVQMIFATDTDGKITPLRFKFKNEQGEIMSYKIEKVKQKSAKNTIGQTFLCEIIDCGSFKTVCLSYHFGGHRWSLIQNPSSIHFLMYE